MRIEAVAIVSLTSRVVRSSTPIVLESVGAINAKQAYLLLASCLLVDFHFLGASFKLLFNACPSQLRAYCNIAFVRRCQYLAAFLGRARATGERSAAIIVFANLLAFLSGVLIRPLWWTA